MSSSFRDLRVCKIPGLESLQESIELTAEVYGETLCFPKHEMYGLTQ
jgi:hypothetical protein